METKLFEITETKSVKEDDDQFYLYGYANNKGVTDAHGDVATGNGIYDLSRYKKNPILLVDHQNSASMVAGKMVELEEDAKGLRFKAKLFTNASNPLVKHAVDAAREGFIKGLSIGGIWEYNKKDDGKAKRRLTGAKIHEISLVGIGSNPESLVDRVDTKKIEKEAVEPIAVLQKSLDHFLGEYRETKSTISLKSVRRLAIKINNLKKEKLCQSKI